MLYTIKEVANKFSRCTTFMVTNYRHKTGAGIKINGKVYFTEQEVEDFINQVEKDNIDLRYVLYDFIKEHPGLKESNLHNHLGTKFNKTRTAMLLADITLEEGFDGLYEDDKDCLFIEGHEINLNKKYNKNDGIFY